MATTYTTLLGLALPTTGELANTWGDTVNDYLTKYVDAAVAGAQTISGSQTAVTLSTTNGSTLSQAGSGATGSAQYAIINCTGNPASMLTITAPSTSKAYLVINATSTSQSVKVVASGPTTGVTIASGRAALIAWNGSDYVRIASNDASSLSGILPVANGGTGLSSGTSGGVLYYSASGTLASSAALAANALVLGGGAGAAPATTTTGTGVVTAAGNAVNTTGGFVTQSGTLTASALLLGGGASTAISSTTTGSGVVTALGNAANASGGFTTINGTATLTNKRIDPRVSSTSSASSLTPDIASFDMYAYTALAANLTINAPTGTPVDGNKLLFRFLDNGTPRTLTWNATYTAIGVTLPTATVTNKTIYVGCVYNAGSTRWDVIAVVTQA